MSRMLPNTPCKKVLTTALFTLFTRAHVNWKYCSTSRFLSTSQGHNQDDQTKPRSLMLCFKSCL